MSERIESERDKKLQQLHHDIQNCLSVISMGTDILADSRNDDDTFAKLYKIVRENRIEAAKLLDEFLKKACDECN